MKYIFEVAARVDENEPIEVRHSKIINALKTIDNEWGIDSATFCPAPEFGKNDILAIFSLKKKLRGPVNGDIMYVYRRLIEDNNTSDDRIYIDFNTKNIHNTTLISDILPIYVSGFTGYRAELYPYKLTEVKRDIPFDIKKNLNYRRNLAFFCPFHYMDDILIDKLFGFSADQLFDLLKGKIYDIEKINGGVYIKASDRFLTENEALKFNFKMQELLGKPLP